MIVAACGTSGTFKSNDGYKIRAALAHAVQYEGVAFGRKEASGTRSGAVMFIRARAKLAEAVQT